MASRSSPQEHPVSKAGPAAEEISNLSTAVQSEQAIVGPQTTIYEPLDTSRRFIRLINILPTEIDNNDTLSCHMYSVELTFDLKYAALSYVWGDAQITADIVVNGQKLSVTTNLASALWHFRTFNMLRLDDDGGFLPLWADAICINQHDTAERNHQVAFMGVIYRNAHNVLSWLGPRDEDEIDLAFQVIREIHSIHNSIEIDDDVVDLSYIEYLLEPTIEYMRRPEMCVNDCAGFDCNARRKSLDKLQEREYWHRIWILSEITLARLNGHFFIYGDETIEGEKVAFWLLFIMDLNFFNIDRGGVIVDEQLLTILTGYKGGGSAMRVAMGLRKPQNPERNYLLFGASLSATATDPRDIIYAFYGVKDSAMEPDYAKSVRDVFLEWFTEYLIENHTKALIMLQHAGIGLLESNDYNLPSWFAHIYKPRGLMGLPDIISRNQSDDFLLDELQLPKPIVETTGVLTVYGARFTTVTRVLHMQEGDCISSLKELCVTFLEQFHPCGDKVCPLQDLFLVLFNGWDYNKMARLQRPSSPSCALALLFFSCLKADMDNRHDSFRRRLGLDQDEDLPTYLERKFYDFSNEPLKDQWITVEKDILENHSSFIEFLESDASSVNIFHYWFKIAQRQSVLINEQGSLAKGPHGALPGDQICFIDGPGVPTILRNDGNGWVFVGSCWILDLYGEEVLGMFRRNELTIERFDIH